MSSLPYQDSSVLIAFGWTVPDTLPSVVYLGTDADAMNAAIATAGAAGTVLVRRFRPFIGQGSELSPVRFGS